MRTIESAAQVVVQDAQDLATEINHEHQAAEKAQNRALQHARKAGVLLIKAQIRTPYGGWGSWVKTHCEFSYRTARLYMRLAKKWPEIEAAKNGNGVANLSLRDAADLIAESSDDDGDEPEPAQEDTASELPAAAGPAAALAPATPTSTGPEPERDPETGETLDEVMPDDLDEATVYRQENERLEKRNAELEALVESFQAEGRAQEIGQLHHRLAQLDGRLGQAMTTAHEATKDARRYLKVLDRLRHILGVRKESEIVAAVEWQARQIREFTP